MASLFAFCALFLQLDADLARLTALVATLGDVELRESVTRLELALADYRGGKPAGDDLSVLALECG